MMMKKIVHPRQQSKKCLDSWYSRYIRLLDSNSDWMCMCITCKKIDHRKNMQLGHFISRIMTRYRRDDRNCHVQCNECNCIKSWNIEVYEVRMRKKYGDEVVEEMKKDKRLSFTTSSRIEDSIVFYKNKVNYLLSFLKDVIS